MLNIFQKLFCSHDWKKLKEVARYETRYDCKYGYPYKHIYIYTCKKCGKLKKIET